MSDNYYQPDVISDSRALESNKVLRQAYLLVGLSMLPTILGVVLGFAFNFINFVAASPMVYAGIFFAGFYGLCFAIEKNKTNTLGIGLMFTLTFFLGVNLQPLLFIALRMGNGIELISIAAGGTALMFMGLAAIGSNAERDFSSFGKILGLLVPILIVSVLLNVFFLQMPTFSLIVSLAFIPISSMIIIYRINSAVRGGEDNYISLALDIYIGLYNIFTSLLRILIIFSGRD